MYLNDVLKRCALPNKVLYLRLRFYEESLHLNLWHDCENHLFVTFIYCTVDIYIM